MGRPQMYRDNDVVFINSRAARSVLQSGSQRRAIVQHIVEVGGRATLGEIDEHFGFDIRSNVLGLVYSGWLEIVSQQAKEKIDAE